MNATLIIILILTGIAFLNLLLFMFSRGTKKFPLTLARIFLGITFIFSGFVKAVDPLGSMYKFQDYFIAFGWDGLIPAALTLGILLCAFEFLLGFSFLFNARVRFFSYFMMLFMLFFTILTLILAIGNPVSDCGCFGDALILTNWETFYKNIALILFAITVFAGRNKIRNRFPNVTQIGTLAIGLGIVLWISIHSYRHLPLIDFMAWKKGTLISAQVVPTPEISEITLIYKNKETGQMHEYTSKTLPWQDTAFFKKLVFVDQKKKVIQEYREAPIHDFIVDDRDKITRTADLIANPGFQFLLVMYDVGKAERSVFKKVNPFFEACRADSIAFAALCGSDWQTIDYLRHETRADFDFYTVDETALKSVVRSNPGLVLLKSGVVVDKWAWRDFPQYKRFLKDTSDYNRLAANVIANSGSQQ